ncbi:SPOR domain-containing protein [Thiopseudomonas denitrificans]|uniref:Sporulation related protein n=1 Tax=Thiopseudomonas denitrificans TaxID=1501432 RepID=A0A4R6TRZ2_9GAMM|nr:SPOR domain-containing protein [Thiopseudomonas denitrificans]TDQ36368.1 sporulation related protein [Thiopseudomonas denitrificans]
MRLILLVLVAANIAYFAWQNYFNIYPERSVPVRVVESQVNGLPSLVLLSESRVERSWQQTNPVVPQGLPGGRILLGGFVSRDEVDELRQRLLGLGIAGQVVQKDVPAEEEFWVYMPPLSSRAATLRLLKELQARKLDGYLITQGELANGISLGIFPHENSAEAVLERLQMAGYQAQIKKISRNQTAYWFEVSAAAQRLLDDKLLESLLKDFPLMQYSQAAGRE